MRRTYQSPELSLQLAAEEAPASAQMLLQLAADQREHLDGERDCCSTRHWESTAGTWCYHTHVVANDQPEQRLEQLANIFFHAAALPVQPWYPQFQGGTNQTARHPVPGGIVQHQLALAGFDVGLRAPRYYRQLISLARPHEHTAVIVARSINGGPPLPGGAKLAYTLAPNGEVLHWQNGQLHWHHICCTPGAGLLPTAADRWLINLMRAVKLDHAERRTYRREALLWRKWLTGDALQPSPEDIR